MRTILVAGAQLPLVIALAEAHRAAGAHVVISAPQEVRGTIDEVWHVPLGPECADPVRALRADTEDAEALLEAACALGVRRLVQVAPATAHQGYVELAARVDGLRRQARLDGGTVAGGPAVPARPMGPDTPVAGVAHVIDSIRWVHSYVKERHAGYFTGQPLRLIGTRAARLGLAWADDLARDLVAGPAAPASTRSILLGRLLAIIEEATGVRLLLTGTEAELNAVDRLLMSRLGAYRRTLMGESPPGDAPGAGPGDERRILAYSRHPADRGSAPAGGRPCGCTPIVIVNALGQGPGYWSRLLARLRPRHQVVLVTPRRSWPDGKVATFSDHLGELHQAVTAASREPVHLVGWCTGAKTVLAYQRSHPGAVRAVTLLNPAFKHPGRPAELDSAYEQDLETLARLLAARPQQAGRVLRTFTGRLFAGIDASRQHGAAFADAVLAAGHPALEGERRAPFASAQELLTYTSQLLDFWSHNGLADAGRMRFPVQLVGATHDRIVTLSGIREAVKRIPGARYVEIEGASHYSMYDRPEAVAALIEELTTLPR